MNLQKFILAFVLSILTSCPGGTKGIASYKLPRRPNVADAFEHEIIVDHRQNQYWMIRIGAFAGHSIAFGPAPISGVHEGRKAD
jgi:hypothetical protein